MDENETTDEVRSLSSDGVELRGPTLEEIRYAFERYSRARARRRKLAGLPTEPGEHRGEGHTLSRLVVWFLAQPEDAREAIQEQGDADLDRLRRLPPEQGDAHMDRLIRPAAGPGEAPGLGHAGGTRQRIRGRRGEAAAENQAAADRSHEPPRLGR